MANDDFARVATAGERAGMDVSAVVGNASDGVDEPAPAAACARPCVRRGRN
jgi:hypothetical protein